MILFSFRNPVQVAMLPEVVRLTLNETTITLSRLVTGGAELTHPTISYSFPAAAPDGGEYFPLSWPVAESTAVTLYLELG